ncbi:MAG TPA: CRTAC1 family protein [Steroidobacteraceae bacterium]|nr:CRTAC1 family protein [Steroidobacteraceae bacterium]
MLAGIFAAGALCACAPDKNAPQAAKVAPAQELFVDATESSGIRFQHFNGRNGEFYYPEIIGSGVAVFDYNNDGKLDILVMQGAALGPGSNAKAPQQSCTARLYRNDLVVNPDGTRTLKYTDVTEASGLCSHGYGMGVAIGDYNNDGCADVFITHFGAPNQLFRNNCDGTFTDVTRQAGVAGNGHWGSSATFVDYDRDGLLDLYVANYVDYRIEGNRKCYASTSARDYCAPSAYKPVPGVLYHNRGDGTFEDVSVKSGITRAFGAGLGVMAVDLDGDGWPDIYVANDGNPNQLWINQKNGTFKNEADLRGCAVNADGVAEAGMGVDIADLDGNGTEDIFLTHLTREKSTLFVNRGTGYFEDRSVETGVAAPSIPFTGFGTVFFDYDNDGWLDIVAVNGAVHLIEELKTPQDPYPLQQRKQLFHNLGNGHFEETTASAGAVFQLVEVGRGLAAGDLDNDGSTDLVVSNNNGSLRVILNRMGSAKPWLGLRLLVGKRDAYGATVEIRRQGAPTLRRRVRADGSYLSANDPRILVGLGDTPQIQSLTVHWPDGRSEAFPVPPLRQYTTLVQSDGLKESKK